MCRLDRVTSKVCVIYLICAQGLYQMVGKSRQGLPQPSSHGSAIPRRSTSATSATVERHFSVVGFAFAGRRKSQSAKLLANLAFAKLNLPTSKLQ